MSDNQQINVSVVDGLPEAPQDGVIYGRKDAAWTDMTAPANLQVRRGTAAEVAAITPLEGEPVWVTDENRLVVGDTAGTLGGLPVGGAVFDGAGGRVELKVVAAEKAFSQDDISFYGAGALGLTVPANSLVIGSAVRFNDEGLADGDGQLQDFDIGWTGDTDALFSQVSASAGGTLVRMFQPIWLEEDILHPLGSRAVVLDVGVGGASGVTGILRISVYYYSITPPAAF